MVDFFDKERYWIKKSKDKEVIYPFLYCYFKRTTSNIFITFTDIKGNIVYTVCTGDLYRVSNKKLKNKVLPKKIKCSVSSITKLGFTILEKLFIFKVKTIVVKFKTNPGNFLFKKLIEVISNSHINIRSFVCINSKAHNGCRGRKKRRV